MSKRYFLGIDTSNYTTSLALVNEAAKLVDRKQQLLPVKSGQRGLRQSEALFWHVKQLPQLVTEMAETVLDFGSAIQAIAVTSTPRPMADSYMPVFLAGEGLARSLAAALNVELYTLSHQENHIWAGLASGGGPKSERFLAVHLSGGTSEIVSVTLQPEMRFDIEYLGGTNDLHAGQFVDRVGVALGFPFPSGMHLERLAKKSTKNIVIPSYHHQGEISFAGPESAALRLIEQEEPADIAKAVLLNIGRTVTKLIRWSVDQTNLSQVLVVGGVAANSFIRTLLVERLTTEELFFAAPQDSTDNAYGAAIYCQARYGVDITETKSTETRG